MLAFVLYILLPSLLVIHSLAAPIDAIAYLENARTSIQAADDAMNIPDTGIRVGPRGQLVPQPEGAPHTGIETMVMQGTTLKVQESANLGENGIVYKIIDGPDQWRFLQHLPGKVCTTQNLKRTRLEASC
ncbi:uncharacterized protein C8Q71DRAFT_846668 [Rhodofomes roseus]|uniref:Pilin n=1 Tax=Rhodofomes roseus TaxID=34475 RepID=A0ABQ8KPZ5_9APHY|nr:uncharacterized protein C8Q71DRAFT_846668 [Rhodofomes roseus]KAH9840263.1 hypothetical protein C8Q71DRAFT_846668 [Rhodofomes roseus]